MEQIKSLPSQEKWTLLQFLRNETGECSDADLAAEFATIGSDPENSDVGFALEAQADVVKHA